MNIVVLGAGAIGSLFGAFLSQNNDVILVGRSYQKNAIQKYGLTITGKTKMIIHPPVVDCIQDVDCSPDLILITVKSYDTDTALNDARPLLTPKTLVLSLQNGLDNLEKMEKIVEKQNIFGGVTTHGAFFVKPGIVEHTGLGRTVIGAWDGRKTEHVGRLVSLFNNAGIPTKRSSDLRKDIWEKAVINSSINPLTAFFSCTNGYLSKNPVLDGITQKICYESTMVARSQGIEVSFPLMVRLTKQVIRETAANFSSMLQSVQQRKKTEIDAINGVIVRIGQQQGIDVSLNQILVSLISSLSCNPM